MDTPKNASPKNTHWKNLFDYEFLGSHNLNKGEEIVCTIKTIEKESVKTDRGEEELPIAYFDGDFPKMVLNKTNCKTISKFYSPQTSDWIGKKIQIYATTTKAFGEMVDCLRVRDFIPREAIDNASALKKLKACKTLEKLRDIYKSLPPAEQSDSEVITLKDLLKTKLS